MKLQRLTISSPQWSDILVLRPIPSATDPWGDLAPLRGTEWEGLVQVVDGEVFSHALHGHVMPLIRVLQKHPKALLAAVPEKYRPCDLRKGCIMHQSKKCHPCVKVPDCYIPSGLEEDQSEPAGVVCRAWAEGRYVLVVKGQEFSF